MQMQLHALNGIQETIAALKVEAAGYRAQRDALTNELPVLRKRLRVSEDSLRNKEGSGETSQHSINSEKRFIANIKTQISQTINGAMLLEQRAATIEGSIISLTLQAQMQAAAAAPAPVAPVPVPAAAPVPVPAPVVTKSVIITAPVSVAPPVTVTEPEPVAPGGTMTRAGAGSFIPDVQVPEAPLPVMLPPISRMQPAAAAPGAPISEPAPATDLQKLLPWALAAGAAFLFMNKPKRKRRYG